MGGVCCGGSGEAKDGTIGGAAPPKLTEERLRQNGTNGHAIDGDQVQLTSRGNGHSSNSMDVDRLLSDDAADYVTVQDDEDEAHSAGFSSDGMKTANASPMATPLGGQSSISLSTGSARTVKPPRNNNWLSFWNSHTREGTVWNEERNTHDGRNFNVRNSGYKKSGEKIPSDRSMYNCIGSDLVRPEGKQLHWLPSKFLEGLPRRSGWRPDWGVPEILILNCMAPFEKGGMWGAHPVDDYGFNFFSYNIISEESIRLLESGEGSTGLNHWKRILDLGKSSRKGVSFKMIGQVMNFEILGVPSFLNGYNGKPVLVTDSCSFRLDEQPRIAMLSYDLRQWAYLLRRAVVDHIYKNPKMPLAEVELGWLVEGKEEDELPEQMLACQQVRLMNPNSALLVQVEED